VVMKGLGNQISGLSESKCDLISSFDVIGLSHRALRGK